LRFIALLASLVLVSSLSCAAIVRTTTVANPDGSHDTAFPTGNKPQEDASLACNNSAQPQPTNQVVGTAYSHNVRQYFSGTAASTATLALVTVSGDDAAANGWSISGNNLINAGTDSDLPGSGILRITGTVAGFTTQCSGLNWVYSSSAPSNAIKFHPGFYPWYIKSIGQVSGYRLDDAAVQAELLNWVTLGVCPQTRIRGIKVVGTWKSFEGDTPGSYSGKYAFWDSLLSALDTCGKFLLVDIGTAYFGGQGSDWSIAFPKYLVQTGLGGTDAAGTYGIVPPDSGQDSPLYAKVWAQATADRFIALIQAYGARYNGNARFEMMSIYSESAFDLNLGTGGYSDANYLTQLARVVPAFRMAWPNTQCRLHANWNYGLNNANMLTLMQLAANYQCSVGGPDTIPHEDIQANQVYTGETGTDFRGGGTAVMAFTSELQSPSLCDEKDSKPNASAANNYTYSDFYTHMFSGNPGAGIRDVDPGYVTFYVSLPGDPCTQANQNWGAVPPNWGDQNSGGALDFIQGNPSVNSVCPSGFASCNTTP